MVTRRKPEPAPARTSTRKRAVSFRLDDATIDLLDAYADKHGVDRSAALRDAIEALTGHTPAAPDRAWRRGLRTAQ